MVLWNHRSTCARVYLLALGLSLPCGAQTLMRSSLGGVQVHIINSDMAVLRSGKIRDDLPCQVVPLPPKLGFDLQFLAGYRVSVPLKALAGSGDSLRMLFRILPLDGGNRYSYFLDRYNVPAIELDAEGEAVLAGQYVLGPGRYRVEWLMRNRAERVCAKNWEIETNTAENLDALAATRGAYTVAPRDPDLFSDEPPVLRSATADLLHVKILINFTPSDPRDLRLRQYDLGNIVSIIRAISREPNVGVFSVVAFNMQQERVIFEQDSVSRIDFPGLGKAIEVLEDGMIDVAQLQDEESGTRFLTGVLQQHLGKQEPEPDAIIILGPKLLLDKKVSIQRLAEAGRARSPIFYFIYDTTPSAYPWRDAISNVLRLYKGLEYTITLPKDLGKAMHGFLSRFSPKRRKLTSWQPDNEAAGQE